MVLRAARLPGEAAGRDARAGRQRQPARQHADRLDQRAGQGQLAHAGQHPVRAGRQRPRLQDGPLAQVPAACRTTACCCRWPTASATGSRRSATPTSAATARSAAWCDSAQWSLSGGHRSPVFLNDRWAMPARLYWALAQGLPLGSRLGLGPRGPLGGGDLGRFRRPPLVVRFVDPALQHAAQPLQGRLVLGVASGQVLDLVRIGARGRRAPPAASSGRVRTLLRGRQLALRRRAP